ncbi:MAG: c-type cytochrome [Deltaproteobacteria bacterium]|nr:c-type cytochrome [Deltaproteobacteria bacterium]
MIRSASLWAPLVFAALTLAACACGEDAPAPTPTTPRVDPSMLEAAMRHQVAWTDEARASAIAAGTEAITRNQCNRCHVIDDVAAAGRSEHCVSCHVFLDHLPPDDRRYRTLVEHYGEAVIQRYQRNIEHYLIAPDLTSIGARLRPEWIAEFIAEPQDLRPMMDETMVRTRLSDADRSAIVRYFAAVARVADPGEAGASAQAIEAPPRPSDEAMAEGRRLFTTHACNTCHMLGNVDLGRSVADLERAGLPARLAPNLRFVRERIHPDVALQWILDPQSLHPETTMPNLHLTSEEATLLRDWIWHVDPELEPTPAPSTHALPPALDRPVSWEEVKERVLGRICVHCHMNDHERDPGPGHVGGYGWPAAGLRMRTYESLVSGMPCADPLLAPRGGGPVPVGTIEGERCSVLEPRDEGGIPPLLAVMLLRHDEEPRDRVRPMHDHARAPFVSQRPGMPMGLPSIPDDELALVRAWIEQGCVGPAEISGMPGIPDGFLVPDGPIAVNRGCEVRPPASERPAWATQPPPAFWH